MPQNNNSEKNPKFIVVCGGVISGVGKGVTTSSIGKILQEYGYSVTAVKIDPYINCDAGTLRPTEHGEVWVTDDGGEIDQDLGNYERFFGQDISRINNITTGQVYRTIIEKERKGEFLGQTVEVIPHVPNEIKRRILEASEGYDFALVEVGGTVGDYQNIPFLFAMKSLERELGEKSVIYVLVSYLPVPRHSGEMKTKPTQQAIRLLTESGIFPDFVLCRAPVPVDEVRKKKIEMAANIPLDCIISEPDIDTIYRIPLDLEKEELGAKILKKFGLEIRKIPEWNKWKELVGRIANPNRKVKVAMIGKYVDIGDFCLSDSYISVNQALVHAGAALDVGIDITWIDSKKLELDDSALLKLKEFDGIIVPGGFGSSGVEGKIKAVKFARENDIPYLGLCYGMQLALIEFARNVLGFLDANTTEIDANTTHPVIDILPSQVQVLKEHNYGGSMRLGAYAAILDEDSRVLQLYREAGRILEDEKKIELLKKDSMQSFRLGVLDTQKSSISGNIHGADVGEENVVLERHRHRYEVSSKFIKDFENNGMKFSGYHTRLDGTKLMEFIELPEHRYFVATQAHPEFRSRLSNPSPLFYGFVKACAGIEVEQTQTAGIVEE